MRVQRCFSPKTPSNFGHGQQVRKIRFEERGAPGRTSDRRFAIPLLPSG